MRARGRQGYSLEGVSVAGGFGQRWRGLMARRPAPLLIPTRSVHGFWLRRPLRAVGLDGERTVIASRILRPRRIVFLAGARWVLELPTEIPPPEVGDVLTFSTEPGEADLHARTALPVRHPHRKSG